MILVIRKIRERGISILIIEHLMQAIMSLSDRVVVLSSGQKLAEGAPSEVALIPWSSRPTSATPRSRTPCTKETRMGQALLQIESLEAGYGEVQVLWGVSLAASARRS